MTNEAKRTRAQYFNGLGVSVNSLTVSVVLAGGSWWLLVVGVVASVALHIAAVLMAQGGTPMSCSVRE